MPAAYKTAIAFIATNVTDLFGGPMQDSTARVVAVLKGGPNEVQKKEMTEKIVNEVNKKQVNVDNEKYGMSENEK